MSSTTASLSYSLSNYRYLKVNYRLSTSNSLNASTIVPISDFTNMSGNSKFRLALGFTGSDGSVGYRLLSYSSSTSIKISAGYNYTGGTSNSILIPTAIYGLG